MNASTNFWTRLAAGAALLTTFAVGPANAQYTNPYTGNTFNNPMSSFLDTVIMNNMQTQQLMTSQMIARSALEQSFSSTGKKRHLSVKEKATADRFAKYRGTMFSMGKPIMPARMAATFIKEPGENRQKMEQVFGVLLNVYNQRANQQGAPPNDVARTLAYCIAGNYMIYNNKNYLDEKGITALRARIRAALSSEPKFRALSNAKKQEMSETMVILPHLAAGGAEVAGQEKGEAAQRAKEGFRKLAGVTLQGLLGVTPDRVTFQKTGLVIR